MAGASWLSASQRHSCSWTSTRKAIALESLRGLPLPSSALIKHLGGWEEQEASSKALDFERRQLLSSTRLSSRKGPGPLQTEFLCFLSRPGPRLERSPE